MDVCPSVPRWPRRMKLLFFPRHQKWHKEGMKYLLCVLPCSITEHHRTIWSFSQHGPTGSCTHTVLQSWQDTFIKCSCREFDIAAWWSNFIFLVGIPCVDWWDWENCVLWSYLFFVSCGVWSTFVHYKIKLSKSNVKKYIIKALSEVWSNHGWCNREQKENHSVFRIWALQTSRGTTWVLSLVCKLEASHLLGKSTTLQSANRVSWELPAPGHKSNNLW